MAWANSRKHYHQSTFILILDRGSFCVLHLYCAPMSMNINIALASSWKHQWNPCNFEIYCAPMSMNINIALASSWKHQWNPCNFEMKSMHYTLFHTSSCVVATSTARCSFCFSNFLLRQLQNCNSVNSSSSCPQAFYFSSVSCLTS